MSIYSLAFSSDGQYLAASSNTETVHVFRLELSARGPDGRRQSATAMQQAPPADGADGGWMGYLGMLAKLRTDGPTSGRIPTHPVLEMRLDASKTFAINSFVNAF